MGKSGKTVRLRVKDHRVAETRAHKTRRKTQLARIAASYRCGDKARSREVFDLLGDARAPLHPCPIARSPRSKLPAQFRSVLPAATDLPLNIRRRAGSCGGEASPLVGRLKVPPADNTLLGTEQRQSWGDRDRLAEGGQHDQNDARDFSPGLLALYDFYAHGKITKREFLDGATKFAVGGVTAVALLTMLKPNYALSQQVSFNDPDIVAEYVTHPSPNGHGEVKGYLVKPAGGEARFPAMVVVQASEV